MPPFWISIAVLSLVQGAVVALPRAATPAPQAGGPPGAPLDRAAAGLERLRARGWAAILPASVIAFVLIGGAAESASAQALTYLALVAVPLLALAALAVSAPRAAGWAVPVAAALFALAWVDRG
ncbi:MAG TPA: hypothetical protein VNZ05_05760, partial [Solirubrobacteraceae bacterium]|nr:hypothetical protein [Solirubrobacteraceae bacterium]